MADDFILGGYPDNFDPTGDIAGEAEDASHAMLLEAEQTTLTEFGKVTSCFRTSEGKNFLAWLKQHTVDLPAFFPESYPLGQSGRIVQLPAAEQGFIREGQNMIYREIARMMEAVEVGPSDKLTAHMANKEAENA